MSKTVGIAGVSLEIEDRGTGAPLLFLHPGEGLRANLPWIDALARTHRVIAPNHPGFGGSSLPDWFGTVDEIAYLYLDLIKELRLSKVLLVGNCFGAWVAAEMAVRSTAALAGLVLAGPVGVKFSGVTERDILDMHSMPRPAFLAKAWADPAQAEPDYTAMTDTELAGVARGRESLALFGWKPYMHNPRLRRWLHRIDVPTKLLWGEQDGVVSADYCRNWCGEIAGATLETIPNAGHYPQWEQPDAFAAKVAAFAATLS